MLTVAPGTTVTWVNEDDSPHTVTEQAKLFRSAALDTSDRFTYTFAQPGEFAYYCTLHPMMVGKIVVKRGRRILVSSSKAAAGANPVAARGRWICAAPQAN